MGEPCAEAAQIRRPPRRGSHRSLLRTHRKRRCASALRCLIITAVAALWLQLSRRVLSSCEENCCCRNITVQILTVEWLVCANMKRNERNETKHRRQEEGRWRQGQEGQGRQEGRTCSRCGTDSEQRHHQARSVDWRDAPHSGAKTPFCSRFMPKNEQFTKTGSGQTWKNDFFSAENKGVLYRRRPRSPRCRTMSW